MSEAYIKINIKRENLDLLLFFRVLRELKNHDFVEDIEFKVD